MRLKNLVGKEILDASGDKVGYVADLDIDLHHGAVRRVIGKSGLMETLFINPHDLITAGDRMILKSARSEISHAVPFRFANLKRRLLFIW